MRSGKMAYWLDVIEGEWGMVGTPAPESLRMVGRQPNPGEVKRWVDRFVDLASGERKRCIVEDRAEFEFLYRCLERIGKTISFSPMSIDTEGNVENRRLIHAA
ncbi:MAG: hypothetical protein H6752_11815 [Candidatus Omnitrophica bacterium]|nr:hypothetical protein [Candidatus Omnitrophota bacterium]MCB9768871.1 hypothetical protein [Candidatus Omnitrophota bacterium]